MDDKDSPSMDIFGIRPLGQAINTVTKGTVDAAAAFLSRICLPVAEEFGLLMRDRVSAWRGANALAVVMKAQAKLDDCPDSEGRQAHPRVLAATLEYGSWTDDDLLQEMWAGLLVSSCTEDGRDESNLIFINILSQMTSSQVTILDRCCRDASKVVSGTGWIAAHEHMVTLEQFQEWTGISDLHRIDRELDHLCVLGLIRQGFVDYAFVGDPASAGPAPADASPTGLALNMFARCQGFVGSPLEFFGLLEPPPT